MTSRPGRTQHPYSQSCCLRPQATWRAHAAAPFWRGLNLHLTTTTRMRQQQPGWHAHTCPSLPPGARTAVRVSAAGAASAAPPATHERMPPAGPRDEQQLQPQPPSARRRAAAGDLGLPGPHVAEDFSETLTGPSNTLQQQQPQQQQQQQQQQQSQQGVRQERAILDSDLTTDRSRLNPVYRMIRKKELQYKRGQAAGAGRQLRQVQRGRGAAQSGAARPATEGEASEESGGKGRGLSGAGEAAAMAKGQQAAWRYTSDAGSSTVDAWPAPKCDGSGSGGGGDPGFAGAAADSVIRDSDMATDRSRMNPVYRLIRKTELRYRRTLAEEEKLAAMRGPGPALGDTEQWRQAQRALRVPAPGSGSAAPGDAGSINAGGGGAAASDGSGPAAAPEYQQQRIAPTGNTAVDRTIRIRQILVRMRREAQQQAAAGWGEGRATSAVGPDPARRYTRVRPLSSLSTPAAAGAVDDASWLGTEAAAAQVAADAFAKGLVEPQTCARPRPSNSFAAASVAADSDAGGLARARETEENEEEEESDGAWRASPWGLPARSSMVQDSELATDRARLNPVFRLIRKTELQKRLARRQADLVSPFKLGGLEEVMTSGGPSKPGIVPSAYLGSVLDPGAAGGVVGRPAPAVRLARGTVAAPRTAAVLQPSVATAPETDSTVAAIAAAGGAAPEAAGSLQRQELPLGVAAAAAPDGKGGLPGAHGDTNVTAAAATLGGGEPVPAVDSRSGSGSPTAAPERQQQRIAPTGNAAVDRTIRIRQILLRMRQEAQQRAAEGRLQGPAAAAAAARSLPSAGQAGPSGMAAPHRVRMPWEPWLPGVGVSLGGAAAVGSAAPAPPASARPAARAQGGGASPAAKAKGKGQQEGADDGPRTWRRAVAENLTDAHVQSLQRFQREFSSLHIATFLGITLPAGYEPESVAREAAGEAGGWQNGALDSGGGAAAAAAGAAAGAVAARVQALQLLLIELGVPSELATQLVSPVLDGLVDAYLVGKRSAEGAGEKVAVLSQLLGTDISQAVALAIKQPSLINRFPDALRSNLEALQSLLGLPRERVVAMVLRYPAVLDMSSKTVASHVEAIAEVLAIDVADPDDMARLTEALCAQPSWLGHDMQSLASKVTAVASSLRGLVQAVGTVGAVGTVAAVAAAVVDRAAEGSQREEVGSGAEGEQRAAGVDGQEAAVAAAEQEEAAASEGKPGLWFFGERMTAAATRDEDVDRRLAARLLLGFPGLLAVSSAKLETKFERLSLLVGGSAAWSREVAGMSPQSLGRCLAASHKVLDRLAYLQATGPAPGKQVLGLAKAVVLSAAEFNAKHPGFAAFQQAHGTKND